MRRDHFNLRRGPWRGLKITALVVAGVVALALFALVFGIVVRELWIWVMPSVFGLGMVTYWQAVGLVLLSKLLFGSFGGGNHGRRFERPVKESDRPDETSKADARSTDDDRWSPANWYQFREFWQAEGRSAF